MIRVLLAATLIALSAGVVSAQNLDVIQTRQKTFKSMLPDLKIGRAMVQGKQPFDAAAAKKMFETFANAAGKLKTLFPEDSKTGGDTEALPAIWENKSDFDAKMAKFEADAKAAGPKVTDLASLKAQWGAVLSNCGGCHKIYREKKN